MYRYYETHEHHYCKYYRVKRSSTELMSQMNNITVYIYIM
jgi:hypothetical protein